MAEELEVKDHNTLFQCEAYQESWRQKKAFEAAPTPDERDRVREWTRSAEYKDLNFAREAVTINPIMACQPLGALFASLGFEKTLPLVHGSQGCVAYFRSHLARHFREPVPAVSSSMTEDAAVFGGLKNLVEALETARALYEPEHIAISTTCMAEVIGDDLEAFVRNARKKSAIPADFPVPFAHTPSFVGSHITGYDNMLRAILEYYTRDVEPDPSGPRINLIPGFDTYVGDYEEYHRLLDLMGIDGTILADVGASFNSPADGHYRMYPGGTPLERVREAPQARATISLARFASEKTLELVREWGQEAVTLPMPVGIRNTDTLVQELARLSGRPIPEALTWERGLALDAMVDSSAYTHGKRVAIMGDPDLVNGLLSFLLEMGVEPIHVVSSNGEKAWARQAQAILDANPYGRHATVYPGKDMWHLRSLLWTEPVDLLIGPTYLKYLSRETGIPLVRAGFPIFDRHHLHRYPVIGYRGVINLVNWFVNTVLDELDRKAPGHSFDVLR
ncbi:Nitrogenase molybdenum-iron protein beta chain [Candidatus Hydrogenisulfobacillus filiaventi]|uniref:Nitrogenase molybdenum-iron protein beta chain n=1 Tax=Candidatus Hydrogenisulfobacillus filiaventi TaxID=2707344 RepID=A0A6F8ZE99_9FIRM|nr:nitrogenase molybdenum-iron protein subunit beta [Bacillota bacterium]CAB1127963.1 Nitrogenase molybdenum-iron protein beta chain [Candidatus Hydrogenisulfobacillus filiaventi]